MNPKNQLAQRLRNFMRGNEHGMTVKGLSESVNAAQDSVRRSLKLMPDTYISEWVLNMDNGRFTAVWKIVTPPADAPEPDENHPRFKPCNPDWLTIQARRKAEAEKKKNLHLFKTEGKKSVKSVKSVEDEDKTPKYIPKLTRWVPVAPWPKGERP